MGPNKPNRTCDAREFGPQPIPRLGLALECVRAREERRLHSFLLFGARGLPQCARSIDQGLGGETLFFGHVRSVARH
jgi:hypothetical protein